MRCDRFDGFPCLTDGKADAHVRCVRPALSTRTSPCARTRGRAARDRRRRGRDGHQVVVDRGGDRGALLGRRRRRLLRRGQLGRAAAALGERRASGRPRQLRPTWSGATTWPTSTRRRSRSRRRRTRRSSRRRSASTTTTERRRRLRATRSATSRCWARATRTSCAPARRGSRPASALDYMARHAIDFWLTTEDLPAPRQPGDGRPRRGASTCARPTTTPSRTGGCWRKLKGLLGHARLHEHADPALVGARPAHPARRRRAPVRHGALRRPTRRRRRSTSTAGRTTSTTSTSSTRASSRARAR